MPKVASFRGMMKAHARELLSALEPEHFEGCAVREIVSKMNDLLSTPDLHDTAREVLEFLENGTPVRQGSELHLQLRGVMMQAEGR